MYTCTLEQKLQNLGKVHEWFYILYDDGWLYTYTLYMYSIQYE